MTWAAAAFTLALLATAEPLAPTAGTVRFMRIANSAFDRYFIRFACSGGSCPQYAADIGDAGFRAH